MTVIAEATILIRRGTKAELATHGALLEGELGFVIDEDRVYIGDGSHNFLIGRVDHASTGPTGNGVAGTLYVNESTDELWFSNGGGWVKVGVTSLSDLSGTLDDIADGTNYKRVAASEFATGTNFVKQINDGTNVVTALEARTHIDDTTKHRVINDSATGSTDLWSAHKILEYVSNNIDGLDWQNAVLTMSLSSPPTGPSQGDRYIVGPSASGGWSGHDGDIAQYQDGSWVFITPVEGFCARVDDQDVEYVYTGTQWISRPAATNHDNLSGLQGGTANEYYHLTAADYAAVVTNQARTIEDTVGGMVSSNTETGISVTYDAVGGKLDFAVAYGSTAPPVVGPMTGTAGTASLAAHADHSHDLGAHDFAGAQHTVGPWTPQALVAVGTGGNTIDEATTIDGGTFI